MYWKYWKQLFVQEKEAQTTFLSIFGVLVLLHLTNSEINICLVFLSLDLLIYDSIIQIIINNNNSKRRLASQNYLDLTRSLKFVQTLDRFEVFDSGAIFGFRSSSILKLVVDSLLFPISSMQRTISNCTLSFPASLSALFQKFAHTWITHKSGPIETPFVVDADNQFQARDIHIGYIGYDNIRPIFWKAQPPSTYYKNLVLKAMGNNVLWNKSKVNIIF